MIPILSLCGGSHPSTRISIEYALGRLCISKKYNDDKTLSARILLKFLPAPFKSSTHLRIPLPSSSNVISNMGPQLSIRGFETSFQGMCIRNG